MHVAIVGNGITGVTAARTVRKLDPKARITLISGESDHHFSRPALMYIYMGHMRFEDTKAYEDHFWPRNRIDIVRGWVDRIDVEARQLHLDGARVIAYDKLLLAVGSKPNRLRLARPGPRRRGRHGLAAGPPEDACRRDKMAFRERELAPPSAWETMPSFSLAVGWGMPRPQQLR